MKKPFKKDLKVTEKRLKQLKKLPHVKKALKTLKHHFDTDAWPINFFLDYSFLEADRPVFNAKKATIKEAKDFCLNFVSEHEYISLLIQEGYKVKFSKSNDLMIVKPKRGLK